MKKDSPNKNFKLVNTSPSKDRSSTEKSIGPSVPTTELKTEEFKDGANFDSEAVEADDEAEFKDCPNAALDLENMDELPEAEL